MKIKKGYHGCSDGGCVFGHPGGMHTNGGCHCIRLKMIPDERVRLRKAIKSLLDERDNLAATVKNMLEWHADCHCHSCKFARNEHIDSEWRAC